MPSAFSITMSLRRGIVTKMKKKNFSVRGNIKKKVKECRALCQSQSSTSVETNSSQLDGTSDCDFENARRDKAKTPC